MGHTSFSKVIHNSGDLVTKPDAIVKGFVEQAHEKAQRAKPIVEKAENLKKSLAKFKQIGEILKAQELEEAVLACAGLSVKAQTHLKREHSKVIAAKVLADIAQLGGDWRSEFIYRYLLTIGDSLGGSMRNWTGASAQQKLVRLVQDKLKMSKIAFRVESSKIGKIQAIWWDKRVLVFDKTPRFLSKNIDAIFLAGSYDDVVDGTLLETKSSYVAAGELKGGIDPAGADEHWKTASKALQRIREAFKGSRCPNLFFAGAAIESSMAEEIYQEVLAGNLEFAVNLTSNAQTEALVNWLISL